MQPRHGQVMIEYILQVGQLVIGQKLKGVEHLQIGELAGPVVELADAEDLGVKDGELLAVVGYGGSSGLDVVDGLGDGLGSALAGLF